MLYGFVNIKIGIIYYDLVHNYINIIIIYKKLNIIFYKRMYVLKMSNYE